MAANVRYRGTYYNTTGTYSTWIIEILDTESVAGVTNVEITRPNESFEGLTQDLKPGIYPASLTFGMYMRSSPRAKQGITYGASIGILTDIASSPEGRFLARLKKDGVIHFVGPIIYDQCSYTDESIPLLNITAVDGLNRWQTTDYISQVGDLRYYSRTLKSFVYDPLPLSYDGPLTGACYTIIEHIVNNSPAPVGGGVLYTATTTWAWREIYAVDSPGSGWVFQGNSRWAHEVSYTNEVETEFVDSRYHLTRDVDDEKHRTILEQFTRAIQETKMVDEYASPAVMFDTSIEWYENDTGDKAADMCGQTKHHEEPLLGGTWNDAIMWHCRQYNIRVYYSKGRYHFEQISIRDASTFSRFKYESDGTLIGVETASLDLDFASLDIEPQAGGVYKFLAPLRSVEASIKLDNANLLEGVEWKDGDYGQRYVGRVKRTSGDQKMWVVLPVDVTSTFDPNTLLLYPQSFLNLICTHGVKLKFSVRIKNINTDTTYWLTAEEPHGFRTIGTWETTETEIEPNNVLNFGTEAYGRYNADNYGYSRHAELSILAETLPGAADEMFDIHVSFTALAEFTNGVGQTMWTTIHAGKFWTISNAITNAMRFYSVASLADFTNWEEAETDAELVYKAENSVANSIRVKVPLAWADTAQHEKSIEIYDGTDWKRSEGWSIGGIGTAVPIGKLLVSEIMSLRTVPKNIYSGAFISSLPNSENRFQRGTDYYLPLSCTRDSDMDLFQGEFLQIAKTTPPTVTTINSPIAGGPIPGLTPAVPIDPPVPTLYFETNEAITAASTLTEVDIVNTLGASVSAGETVSIIHPTSGVSDNVVLTADINPTDTVMYFESNVMVNSYPDASYIVIKDGDTTIESGGNKYNYVNFLYNGSTHSVPVALLDITPYLSYSQNQLIVYAALFRNGTRMKGYTTPQTLPDVNAFWFDDATNSIVFSIEFEDEYLVLRLGG